MYQTLFGRHDSLTGILPVSTEKVGYDDEIKSIWCRRKSPNCKIWRFHALALTLHYAHCNNRDFLGWMVSSRTNVSSGQIVVKEAIQSKWLVVRGKILVFICMKLMLKMPDTV